MVKSRYKASPLIITLVFGIFFIFIPFLVLGNSEHAVRLKFLLFLPPLMGIFLLYSFFQKCPAVVLDPECITAKYITGRKIHSWASVSDVFLSKKESYLGQYVEASVAVFNDQDKLVLWQDMYRNAAQMRSFIFEKAAGKIHDAIPEVKKIDLHAVTRRRYSGNVYTSFNTLLIIGIAVSFSIFLKPLKLTPILLFPVGFLLFLFFMMGTQMNYFLIDDGYLIVKNHYFLWKNRKISLADIEEVDIETPNKRSTGLRIMLRNFNSRLYGAGSLRNKHWDELLNDFKLIGIPARDDR